MCYPGAEQFDSTRSGDVFLSGAITMMVNWFGFAARCDRTGSPLQGKVAIAPIPADEGKPPASLSVFWTLGIGTGSKNKQAAYDFIHFLTQPEMDLGIVKHGTVGVVADLGGGPNGAAADPLGTVNFSVAPTPEPSSILLLLTTVLCLISVRVFRWDEI